MKQCEQCGWTWIARVQNPRECPKCKTHSWATKPQTGTIAIVYALQDPQNEQCFYVGSTHNPIARFNNHLAAKTAIGEKVRSLGYERRKAAFVVLAEVSMNNARRTEQHWIERLRETGHPLLNRNAAHSKANRKKESREPSVEHSPQYHCIKCGCDWNPRADRIDHRPRVCPACKSHYWDKPRADQQPAQTGGEEQGG